MDTAPQIDKAPFVSVLMLTYNRARFIPEAIRSVLTQTHRHLELIIIDDGSTDGTAGIVADFADERIRYIAHKENKGLLARRQESLTLAQGTHVAILDSDDVWLPEKLEKQLAYLLANPSCVLVGSWITRIDDAGAMLGETHYAIEDPAIRQHILWRNQFAHSSVLIRKDMLTKTAGYRYPLDEDLDLFLQLGMHGTLHNIAEPLTRYRIHKGSQSENRRDMMENVLAIIAQHQSEYPGYVLAHIKYTLARILAH